MNLDAWGAILVGALVVNAALAFGYRVFRLTRGGPMADVVGQGILATLLLATALGYAAGADWLRWIAVIYAAVFGAIVMPIWTLAILIPMEPRPVDYGFAVTYWGSLVLVAVAGVIA